MATRSPTTAFVLAFLMVFTIMAGIAPQSEAQAPATTGCLQVAPYPDFSYNSNTRDTATIYARPSTTGGEYNQRTLRIANNCDDVDMDEIRFLYYIRSNRDVTVTPFAGGATTINAPTPAFSQYDAGEPIGPQPTTFPLGTVIISVNAAGNQITTNLPASAGASSVSIGCEVYSPGGAVVDPCSDEDPLITWDADRSYAKGWTVHDDNRAEFSPQTQESEDGAVRDPYIRELVFKATTTQAIRHSTATCSNRVALDGTTMVGTTVTSPSDAQFSVDDIGLAISGGTIPAGATIVGFTNPQTVTISAAAGAVAAGVTLSIGSPAPACSSSILKDTNVNFNEDGIVAGMTLNVLTGGAIGRYTITQVTETELIFSPPAPASVSTSNQYTVVPSSGLNATLLSGGSLTSTTLLGKAQDFTIAFTVQNGANAMRVPIQVVGYVAQYPYIIQIPTPFETTCQSPAAFRWRCLLATDATDMPNGQAPSVAIQLDSGSIRTEIAGTTGVTRDMDENGHIDRFEIDFTKRLDPRSFAANIGQFTIQTRARLPFAGQQCSPGVTCDKYVILGGYLTDSSVDDISRATFLLKEQPYYDTGDTPYIQYTMPSAACKAQDPPSCGVWDLAHNLMRAQTGTSRVAADGAKPVMVGAYARDGFDKLDVFFSEPVTGTGAGGQVTTADLVWFDDGGSEVGQFPCNAVDGLGDFISGGASIDDKPAARLPALGWHWQFTTLQDPLNPGQTIKFGPCDVHPLKGDALGPALLLNVPAIQDAVGLRLAYMDLPVGETERDFTWPSGGVEERADGFARHITYPLIQRVEVDVQAGMENPDKRLKVTFNGPVRYPRAAENRTDTGVTHADMDIASATGTGQGPQGFMTTVFSQGDVDTIILEMDHAARPQDVDNSPSFFKLHCQKVQGTNLLENAIVGSALGSSSYVPCDDPDRYYGWDEDPITGAATPDVAVVDVTLPQIVQALTSDSNHDGYIDGIELRFSEPVNDASFCQVQDFEPNFCSDGDLTGLPWFHDPWSPNKDQRETRSKPTQEALGGFRWDTGLVSNDYTGILQLVNTTYDPSGAPIVRTQNFQTDYGALVADNWRNGLAVFHKQKLPTDYLPHLNLVATGLFTDMAQQPVDLMQPNAVPEYCELYETGEFPGFPLPTLNKGGPGICGIRTAPPCPVLLQTSPDAVRTVACKRVYTTNVVDGAPPVIWKAQTVDTPFYDRDHCWSQEKCHKDFESIAEQAILYGNGTIDGYKLRFSEPVKDSSFCAPAWHVHGYEPASGVHNVTSLYGSTPVETNDSEVTIRFNETVRISQLVLSGARTATYTEADFGPDGLLNADILTAEGQMLPGVKYKATVPLGLDGRRIVIPDTDQRPELTVTPSTCGGNTIADLANNMMAAVDTFGVVEEDGSAPVIISAGGFDGKDFLEVVFSEPVDDGNRGALVRDDFNYYDVDRAGVAGKSSILEVCHGDDDYIQTEASGCEPQPLDQATVPLGSALSAADRAKDRLAAVPGTIREVAPSVPVALRLSVPNVKMPLNQARDATAPGALSNFKVEDALTDAGSVTLSWTAPGDNGLGGGPVFAYEVKVSNTTAITDITKVVNPNGVVLEYERPLADANHTQTVLVTGLQPDTTYHFAARAIDHGSPAPNYGPTSSGVSARTLRDSSAPECLDTKNVVTACPLQISSTNCPPGKNTQAATCTFKWTAAQDKESPNSLIYHYKLSTEELDRPLSTDPATKATSEIVPLVGNGTYYFHVAAFSGGGYTPPAHFKVVVGQGTIEQDVLREANDKLNAEGVEAVRIEQNGFLVNDIRWTLPPESELPGRLIGIEIWRQDGLGSFLLVHARPDLQYGESEMTYNQLQVGNWTDGGGNAESKYRVQMVFAGPPPQSEAAPQTGYKELTDETPEGIPAWAWILIGVGLALLVAGIVIFFVLRGKQKQDAGAVPYAWESANPDAIGIDEATGLPVHEVRCPSCNNPFQAIGNLPLPITCPNCGTTGTLD